MDQNKNTQGQQGQKQNQGQTNQGQRQGSQGNRDQAEGSRDKTRGGQSPGDENDDNRGNVGGPERGTGSQGERNSSGISNRGMSESE